MGLWKDPLVDLQGGYLNKGQILLVCVAISGKGSVEKAKYHSKKQPYIVQSGKVRYWVKPALVAVIIHLNCFCLRDIILHDMNLDIKRHKDIGDQIFLMDDLKDFGREAYFSLIKPVVNQEPYCGTSLLSQANKNQKL